MIRLALTLFMVSVLVVIGCSDGDDENGSTAETPTQTREITYIDISPSEAKDLIDSTPNLTILDVSPFYDRGYIPGAINYPMSDGSLETAIPSLDKSVPYLVYCHSDSVSIAGAQLLIDLGFDPVYRLEGNYSAWVSANYQIGMTATVDWSADGTILSGEYTSSRKLDSDYELYWRTDSEHIYVSMKAKTDGWAAIGFDPSAKMDGADIILGFVTDGQTSIIDSIGTAPINSHPEDIDEGGVNSIMEFGGAESDGSTIIEFKRLLSTGDAQDKTLSDGQVEVIWAYGSGDSPSQRHADRGTSEIILGQ